MREVRLDLTHFEEKVSLHRYLKETLDFPFYYGANLDALHDELTSHKHLTLMLLWQEYKAEHPDGYQYSRFCQHYRGWAGRLSVSMRQTHTPGEKLFVDYAGPTVAITNPLTGEIRQAALFVAVLGASNYTYCEATWSQGLPDWIGSHVRAFEFFGGVPAVLVPDNLKSWPATISLAGWRQLTWPVGPEAGKVRKRGIQCSPDEKREEALSARQEDNGPTSAQVQSNEKDGHARDCGGANGDQRALGTTDRECGDTAIPAWSEKLADTSRPAGGGVGNGTGTPA